MAHPEMVVAVVLVVQQERTQVLVVVVREEMVQPVLLSLPTNLQPQKQLVVQSQVIQIVVTLTKSTHFYLLKDMP